jgi:hypothetical protein
MVESVIFALLSIDKILPTAEGNSKKSCNLCPTPARPLFYKSDWGIVPNDASLLWCKSKRGSSFFLLWHLPP